MEEKSKKIRILFLFPKPVREELLLIENDEAPSERLYGMFELIKEGYDVDYTDVCYEGVAAKVYFFLKRCRIKWLPFTVLRKILRSDIVLIKDDFYTLAALVARIAGKKLIYEDSMFMLPKNLFRRLQATTNLFLAYKIISFSRSQIGLWQKEFPTYAGKFEYIFYPLNKDFYEKRRVKNEEKTTFISVGRDLGRDNQTLHIAIEKLGQSLDLVTLPYLLSPAIMKDPKVTVHQHISYNELFSIYGRSLCSIVPLKKGVTYPSGVRAIMEAMALFVPVIAAKTPVLEEYFEDQKDLIFYDPENVNDLLQKISLLMSGAYDISELTIRANKTMQRYNIDSYARRLLKIIL